MRTTIRRSAAVLLAAGAVLTLPYASLGAPRAAPGPGAPGTERVSTASNGAQADLGASGAVISANGRVVAFTSQSTNLVPGDTNAQQDVFVRDLRTGRTDRVSVASDGTQGDSYAHGASLSADGRLVAFTSHAANLVAGDGNGAEDVFVHDRATGRTERVTQGGSAGARDSANPVLSADGRQVAFSSSRDDLVPGDTNGVNDIFVHDRRTATTKRVSVSSDGTQGTGASRVDPVISADGRRVGFVSRSHLVPGPQEPTAGDPRRPRLSFMYVHDVPSGRTMVASATSNGVAVGASSIGLSPDGRLALFSSLSEGIVPGDDNGEMDIFTRDLGTGAVVRVGAAHDGTQPTGGASTQAALSADNRRVHFLSGATNLVPGDTNGTDDAFVRDLRTGTVERLTVTHDGSDLRGYGPSGIAVDAAGRTVVFDADADNLVPDDTNGHPDVFTHRRR
ncbi:hypothetical protein [Streptomyces sp. SP18CS02]|uniref:hypothetical protein n=1 Tax=Streptomyces sp. SP18CS02 TaxID=3002531 RepID=UPI002E764EA4|nr:hypothetical protein [Streptomyces sp. SP18CS02]MEE1753834.1 hypothetical protein [Streptomyces sp. SP18CS02]